MNHAVFLMSCPDQKGITATITNFVYTNNGNIVHADQHIDEQSNTFFMRIEWELEKFLIPGTDLFNKPKIFTDVPSKLKATHLVISCFNCPAGCVIIWSPLKSAGTSIIFTASGVDLMLIPGPLAIETLPC